MPVNEFHRQVATIVLRVAAEYGFAVGGGTALIAHGIVDRYTADLDLVSPRERAVEAAAALVEAALRAEGLQVERQDRTDGLVDEWPGWEEEIGGGLGEWVITAPGGEEMILQMPTLIVRAPRSSSTLSPCWTSRMPLAGKSTHS